MGFYNWRVTGDPTLLPYKVNQQQYALAQAFLWQTHPGNIEYRHEVMKNFYVHYFLQAVKARSSIGGYLQLMSEKLTRFWAFFIGPILSVLLIALPRAMLDRRIRFLVLTALFAVPGFLVGTWFHAHYAAPFTGIIYVLMLQSLRHIRFSRSISPRTRYAVFLTVPTVIILMTVVAVITFPPPVQGRGFGLWCCNPNGESARSRLVHQLQASGGRHLVFVEYTSNHDADFDDEWVYNAADIDSSPVVFARHMDPTKDLQLIQYFPDRQVWRLVVADAPVKFERYK
jgi:hypothetical protein